MTILSALARAYARLPDASVPGFAVQRVSLLVSLNGDGTVAGAHDLRSTEGKKREPRAMSVPAPVKRTAGVKPNSFWDKTAYALGVTAGGGRRTAEEHAAFVAHQRALLAGTADPGLVAFLRFLDAWRPERWPDLGLPDDVMDGNVVFALEEERREGTYLHARPAAAALLARAETGEGPDLPVCLVTGERAPAARLHPSIKGVWGGQTAGGSIVSFNAPAFESYGHAQGDNAPVSEKAAAAYAGALNRFLERDSGHRIQIGDASTVFWADAEAADAKLAEAVFGGFFGDLAQHDEAAEAKTVGIVLEGIRQGRHLRDLVPRLSEGVRFHVLGLAPNAARISIRFWLENDFAAFADNYGRFQNEMRVEPPPRGPPPALWQYLNETAVLGKRENVVPNLAGEWMRAILAGTPYPMTLLATVLMRLRADGDVNGRRVAILRALLRRNFRKAEEDAPVALDVNCRDRGYLLGRLFAAYERAQELALGGVNASIKDKFYAAASAQPRKVFALLDRGSANHLSKLAKQSEGSARYVARQIGEIMEAMTPADEPFPASLAAPEQALFALGYYHQRNSFFASRKPAAISAAEDAIAHD